MIQLGKASTFHSGVFWSALWFALLACFVALGLNVSSRQSPGVDLDLARIVQKLPAVVGDLLGVANLLGAGWGLTILTAAAVWLSSARRLWPETLLFVGTVVPRFLQEVMKRAFDAPRPSVDLVHVREFQESAAYPSGHVVGTTVVFALLFLLAPLLLRDARLVASLRSFSLLMIASISFARIWYGAHWPSDCLGGYLLAALWLIPAFGLYRSAQTRRWLRQHFALFEQSQPPSTGRRGERDR